ncbi:MAG: sporulation protein YqfD [Lachnospiraceae bacterium]|nr:sporulation protein YqfD [Lachnospiraceae bacterium]
MLRFIRGWVCVSVNGSSPERFMNLCRNRGLVMWNILSCECGCTCCMYRADYGNCLDLAAKAGVSLTCEAEYGLPAYIKRYRNRQAFLASGLLLFFLIWFSSIHIWEIKIENNMYYTDDQILSCLKEQGILGGIRKSEIDCESIEQLLRDHFERISWSAASVDGTVLTINVAENYGTLAAVMADTKPADLVAETDGVVDCVIVRKGIAQVKTGDMVEKGQVLVSGSVPRHDDSQEITGYEFVHADADVKIRSEITYEDYVDPDRTEKVYTGSKGSIWHFRLADRTFSVPSPVRLFWDLADPVRAKRTGTPGEETGTSFTGSGFWEIYVPEAGISLYGYKEEKKEYQIRHRWLSEKEASGILQKKISQFLENMQKNGDVVVENQVRIYYDSVVYRAGGNIVFLRPQAGYQSIDYSAYEAEVNKPEQEASEEE